MSCCLTVHGFQLWGKRRLLICKVKFFLFFSGWSSSACLYKCDCDWQASRYVCICVPILLLLMSISTLSYSNLLLVLLEDLYTCVCVFVWVFCCCQCLKEKSHSSLIILSHLCLSFLSYSPNSNLVLNFSRLLALLCLPPLWFSLRLSFFLPPCVLSIKACLLELEQLPLSACKHLTLTYYPLSVGQCYGYKAGVWTCRAQPCQYYGFLMDKLSL